MFYVDPKESLCKFMSRRDIFWRVHVVWPHTRLEGKWLLNFMCRQRRHTHRQLRHGERKGENSVFGLFCHPVRFDRASLGFGKPFSCAEVPESRVKVLHNMFLWSCNELMRSQVSYLTAALFLSLLCQSLFFVTAAASRARTL